MPRAAGEVVRLRPQGGAEAVRAILGGEARRRAWQSLRERVVYGFTLVGAIWIVIVRVEGNVAGPRLDGLFRAWLGLGAAAILGGVMELRAVRAQRQALRALEERDAERQRAR